MNDVNNVNIFKRLLWQWLSNDELLYRQVQEAVIDSDGDVGNLTARLETIIDDFMAFECGLSNDGEFFQGLTADLLGAAIETADVGTIALELWEDHKKEKENDEYAKH